MLARIPLKLSNNKPVNLSQTQPMGRHIGLCRSGRLRLVAREDVDDYVGCGDGEDEKSNGEDFEWEFEGGGWETTKTAVAGDGDRVLRFCGFFGLGGGGIAVSGEDVSDWGPEAFPA